MNIAGRKKQKFVWMAVFVIIIAWLSLTNVQVEADDSDSVIEFNITEKMVLSGDGKSCNLKVLPAAIEILNTSNRIIGVDSVTASAANGWALIDQQCDFSRLAADSKKISITANGTFDLINRYCPELEIASGECAAILITAKTGAVTEAVKDELAANIIVTLKDMGADMSKVVTYKYPTVDFVKSEETFDHSIYGIGITRTIVGASSIKLVFNKKMFIYAFGEEHTIVVLDKNEEFPYDSDIACTELIVPGDTAFIGVDLVNPGGKIGRAHV